MRLFADRIMPVLQRDAAFQGEVLPAGVAEAEPPKGERLFAPA